MQNDRKLIQIFKTFVQKALIPQIKKLQGSIFEWNKFSSMLAVDSINLNDLQFYVDSLPSGNNVVSFDKKDPNTLFLKKKQENNIQLPLENINGAFNPSKTFGGEKAKVAMFPIKPQLDAGQDSRRDKDFNLKEDPYKNKQPLANAQTILPALQRLYKNLLENQQKIQNMSILSNASTNYEYKGYH